ncbi:MAG: polysaccharide lyase [Pseudonocardia sp.]
MPAPPEVAAPDPCAPGTVPAPPQAPAPPQVPIPPPGAPVPGSPAPGAPTPGAPAEPPVPAGEQLYFTSDYDDGFSDWGTCQSAVINSDCPTTPNHYSLQLIDRDDRPGGGKAARFVVKPGDEASFGGERSELRSSGDGAVVKEGDERWYQWSMRVAEDFPQPDGVWFIVMQWHAGSGSPPLAIDLAKGTVDIGGDGVTAERKTIGPIRRGEWVDYTLHVKFSNSADEGFVEAWENGVRTVPLTKRRTMTSESNYLKQGIYRDSSDTTAVVDFDDFRVSGPPGQGPVQPKLRALTGPVTEAADGLLGPAVGAADGVLEGLLR